MGLTTVLSTAELSQNTVSPFTNVCSYRTVTLVESVNGHSVGLTKLTQMPSLLLPASLSQKYNTSTPVKSSFNRATCMQSSEGEHWSSIKPSVMSRMGVATTCISYDTVSDVHPLLSSFTYTEKTRLGSDAVVMPLTEATSRPNDVAPRLTTDVSALAEAVHVGVYRNVLSGSLTSQTTDPKPS